MQSALLLLFMVAFQASLCTWSVPVKLMESKGTTEPWVASVYRDPSTSLNHAIIIDGRQYRYFAVKDDGTVIHDRVLPSGRSSYTARAVIKGAGNGENLFVAFRCSVEGQEATSIVNFTESKDGGKNWAAPVSVTVLPTSSVKLLLDMLYISETGRVFVFFLEQSKNQIRMVSRPANSLVFSGETTIVRDGVWIDGHAAYTPIGARQYIYVVYIGLSKSQLMYVRSTTNGADWSVPAEISNGDPALQIRDVIAGTKLGSTLYIIYAPRYGPEKLLVSQDRGVSFGKPVPFTIKSSNFWSTDGVAVCAANETQHKLVSLSMVQGYAAEYALWDMKKMEATRKQHPFESFWTVTTTGVECGFDAVKKERVTIGFVGADTGTYVHGVYFAVDREAF